MMTADMIRDVLGDVSFDPTVLAHSTVQGRPKAPGMKYRHYAPKAELTIFEGDNDRVVEKINELAGENERKGLKVGILSSTENEHSIPQVRLLWSEAAAMNMRLQLIFLTCSDILTI